MTTFWWCFNFVLIAGFDLALSSMTWPSRKWRHQLQNLVAIRSGPERLSLQVEAPAPKSRPVSGPRSGLTFFKILKFNVDPFAGSLRRVEYRKSTWFKNVKVNWVILMTYMLMHKFTIPKLFVNFKIQQTKSKYREIIFSMLQDPDCMLSIW